MLDSCRLSCEKKSELEYLERKVKRLEEFVRDFQGNNNEGYQKAKEIIIKEVSDKA
jgi:hypothetical protein